MHIHAVYAKCSNCQVCKSYCPEELIRFKCKWSIEKSETSAELQRYEPLSEKAIMCSPCARVRIRMLTPFLNKWCFGKHDGIMIVGRPSAPTSNLSLSLNSQPQINITGSAVRRGFVCSAAKHKQPHSCRKEMPLIMYTFLRIIQVDCVFGCLTAVKPQSYLMSSVSTGTGWTRSTDFPPALQVRRRL